MQTHTVHPSFGQQPYRWFVPLLCTCTTCIPIDSLTGIYGTCSKQLSRGVLLGRDTASWFIITLQRNHNSGVASQHTTDYTTITPKVYMTLYTRPVHHVITLINESLI